MLTVYGIPNCSTVKKARKWLDARGVAHAFVDFRKHPPARARVATWVAALGSKALKNTSGGSYRALGPAKDDWNDDAWADAFANDPMLVKRPVIERDEVAVLAGFRGTDDTLADRLGL